MQRTSKILLLTIISLYVSFSAAALTFKKGKIKVGSQSLQVELAKTNEEHQQGLMFRKSLDDKQGMLFIFNNEEPRHFWMKNTFIDLDIGFFNKKMELIDIQQMTAVSSEMETNLPTYDSAEPAMYALEVPKGWFAKHGVKKGNKLVLL